MVRLASLLLVVSFLGALGGTARASSCDGALALLVDRSGSMADHDPAAELRLGVAAGLDAARPAAAGDVVAGFGDRLQDSHVAAPGGWELSATAALAGGDEGDTDLAPVLAATAGLAARGLVVITDAEATLPDGPLGGQPIVALITVGGTPAAAVSARVRAMGGRALGVGTVAEARRAARVVCGVASAAARRDVVLVAGLRERTAALRGVTRSEQCAPSADLEAWCTAFAGAGWRVWVPSTAPGGHGALLDSTGALDGNGRALAAWLHRETGPRPVLVGHSMGGLIAHAALVDGARAGGLVTVGTPHAGSYGADAYLAAIAAARGCVLACPAISAGLAAAAMSLRHRFGDALIDLTREQRTHAARLGQPGVPLAVWAGTVNAAPVLLGGLAPARGAADGYFVPNDGIVGRGSATGALAGLSALAAVTDGAARHSRSVPPRSAVTELGSAAVAAWAVAQARRFAGAAVGARGDEARAGERARRAAVAFAPRRRRAVAELRAIAPLSGNQAEPAGRGAIVVATAPIGVLCDGQPIGLLEVAPGLWYLDVGELGCGRIARDTGAAPLASGAMASGAVLIGAGAGVGADAGGERVSAVRQRKGGWRLTLTLAHACRPVVVRGSRPVQLHPLRTAREWAGRRWWASLPSGGARQVTVRVDGGRRPPRVTAIGLP